MASKSKPSVLPIIPTWPVEESEPINAGKTRNEFKLPKSFEIGGMTVTVKQAEDLLGTHGAYGMMDTDLGKMFVQEDLEGDVQATTFYHEKVHMILTLLGKTELNQDEAFVDGMASLLWQAEKTAKY